MEASQTLVGVGLWAELPNPFRALSLGIREFRDRLPILGLIVSIVLVCDLIKAKSVGVESVEELEFSFASRPVVKQDNTVYEDVGIPSHYFGESLVHQAIQIVARGEESGFSTAEFSSRVGAPVNWLVAERYFVNVNVHEVLGHIGVRIPLVGHSEEALKGHLKFGRVRVGGVHSLLDLFVRIGQQFNLYLSNFQLWRVGGVENCLVPGLLETRDTSDFPVEEVLESGEQRQYRSRHSHDDCEDKVPIAPNLAFLK